MLVITDAEARRFADSLTKREYSPATINKYAHDLRLLMAFAPFQLSETCARFSVDPIYRLQQSVEQY